MLQGIRFTCACTAVHIFARINGIESIAYSRTSVDVVSGLQVIGVRSQSTEPASLESPPGGIIENIIRCPVRARHLAYRLLSKDWLNGMLRGFSKNMLE